MNQFMSKMLPRKFYFFTILCLVVFFIIVSLSSEKTHSKLAESRARLDEEQKEADRTAVADRSVDSGSRVFTSTRGPISTATLSRSSVKWDSGNAGVLRTTSDNTREEIEGTITITTTEEISTAATTKYSPTLRPMNRDSNRTACQLELSEAVMCPPFYVDLGGKCWYDNSSIVCNDVRRLSEQSVRQAQLVITRLLDILELIAHKHGIEYWLSSGTLLGAVRHQGFIPWDDDADIEMTLDQYEKFYRYASRDLPHDVFFQNSESDPPLRPSDPEEYQRLKYKDIGLYRRTYNPRLRDKNSCYKYCRDYGCKWHDGAMIDIFVVESVSKSTYPLKRALFEGLHLPIPNDWKQQLINSYGENYMSIPKKISFNSYYPDPVHSCDKL